MAKREQLGWLRMKKKGTDETEVISVYKQESVTFLVRHGISAPYEHMVHESATGLIEEATVVWNDFTVEGSSFHPLVLGYPSLTKN